MAVTATQVQNLYLAYFGRPAEPAGLSYWTAQADATVDQISAAFAQQPEYTNTYGGLTRSQTINQLYQNLFGRAAASDELTYWQNSTDITVDRLALALTNGATGTDRLLLDSKIQYVSALTTTAPAATSAADVTAAYTSAATPVTINGTAYTSLADYQDKAGSSANLASYYAAAAVVQGATFKPVFVASTATTVANGETKIASGSAVNFVENTAGTITLKGADTGSVAVTGADLTALTLTGTVAGNAAIGVSTDATTNAITNLTVSLASTDSTAANQVATLTFSTLTDLTTVDGSASSVGLNIGADGKAVSLANLATLTTGSGADTLFVDTGSNSGSTTAAALTINTGAGADKITSTVNDAALTINAGDGADTIAVTTAGKAALTVNAGAGNDVVTLTATATADVTATHVTSITLGAGNDTLNVAGLANLNGTFTTGTAAQITAANTAIAADLVKVTDFSGSNDVLNLSAIKATFQALDNTQAGNVTSAATLAEAVAAAASTVGVNHATSFAFGGNTYVYVNDATAAVSSGDGLIELTGFSGQLTSANFVGTTTPA